MNRKDILKKAMLKLGMIVKPKDPISDHERKGVLAELWDESSPEGVTVIINKLFKERNPSKEAKLDLFQFFKIKGLFKRILVHNNMERTWRIILKENGITGFMLEN